MSDTATLSNGAGERKGSPETVSLFDERLKDERRTFLKNSLLAFALTTTFIWLANAVYWGSYYRQPGNLPRLGVAIVDLDSPAAQIAGLTPVAGPALLNAAQQDARTHVDHLGWLPIGATRFDLSAGLRGSAPRGVDPYEWATDAVIAEDYFAVIIANANATIAPNDALTTIASGGTTTQYTGKGAYSLYYNEARQFNTVDLWVQPNAARIIKMASINAAAALAQQLSSRLSRVGSAGTLNQTALASVMAQPFGYSTYNVRPLDAYAGIAATTVGQIYLLIYTYFVSLFWNMARQAFERRIRLRDLVVIRLTVPVVQYFFVSLSISLVSIAFQVPFNRFYTRGGFVIFWMSNFLSQTALGYPMEMALTILGPRFTAFFLVVWVILNVSVVFLDIADMASFYGYGFVTPVWNATSIAKSVAFGTKNHMVQNFTVNIAWVVVTGLLLSIIIVRKRKALLRQERAKKA